MWSKPLLCRFQQLGQNQQTSVSQGFAAFRLALSRIPPRHPQSKRATNCANPGFLVIEFCARCGQTCGQAVFLTTSTCGGSACIAGVSRDCGHGIFRLEGGATRSQSRRATNCATPGYEIERLCCTRPSVRSRAVFRAAPEIAENPQTPVCQETPGALTLAGRTRPPRCQSSRYAHGNAAMDCNRGPTDEHTTQT